MKEEFNLSEEERELINWMIGVVDSWR